MNYIQLLHTWAANENEWDKLIRENTPIFEQTGHTSVLGALFFKLWGTKDAAKQQMLLEYFKTFDPLTTNKGLPAAYRFAMDNIINSTQTVKDCQLCYDVLGAPCIPSLINKSWALIRTPITIKPNANYLECLTWVLQFSNKFKKEEIALFSKNIINVYRTNEDMADSIIQISPPPTHEIELSNLLLFKLKRLPWSAKKYLLPACSYGATMREMEANIRKTASKVKLNKVVQMQPFVAKYPKLLKKYKDKIEDKGTFIQTVLGMNDNNTTQNLMELELTEDQAFGVKGTIFKTCIHRIGFDDVNYITNLSNKAATLALSANKRIWTKFNRNKLLKLLKQLVDYGEPLPTIEQLIKQHDIPDIQELTSIITLAASALSESKETTLEASIQLG